MLTIKVGLSPAEPAGDAVADVQPAPAVTPPAVPAADAVADDAEDEAQPSKGTPLAKTVKP